MISSILGFWNHKAESTLEVTLSNFLAQSAFAVYQTMQKFCDFKQTKMYCFSSSCGVAKQSLFCFLGAHS